MKITASTDETITFFLNGTPRVVSGIVIFQYTNINPHYSGLKEILYYRETIKGKKISWFAKIPSFFMIGWDY